MNLRFDWELASTACLSTYASHLLHRTNSDSYQCSNLALFKPFVSLTARTRESLDQLAGKRQAVSSHLSLSLSLLRQSSVAVPFSVASKCCCCVVREFKSLSRCSHTKAQNDKYLCSLKSVGVGPTWSGRWWCCGHLHWFQFQAKPV